MSRTREYSEQNQVDLYFSSEKAFIFKKKSYKSVHKIA